MRRSRFGTRTTLTIDSYSGLATVEMDKGGTWIAACHYVVKQEMVRTGADLTPGQVGWCGTLTSDHLLPRKGAALLRLDDGRLARVIVEHVDRAIRTATFTGTNGPPRLP